MGRSEAPRNGPRPASDRSGLLADSRGICVGVRGASERASCCSICSLLASWAAACAAACTRCAFFCARITSSVEPSPSKQSEASLGCAETMWPLMRAKSLITSRDPSSDPSSYASLRRLSLPASEGLLMADDEANGVLPAKLPWRTAALVRLMPVTPSVTPSASHIPPTLFQSIPCCSASCITLAAASPEPQVRHAASHAAMGPSRHSSDSTSSTIWCFSSHTSCAPNACHDSRLSFLAENSSQTLESPHRTAE
mmetsp:Transcript_51979/g.126817  ORF Transcript_51979/g.126817 Transcript_51979/m.126817 type:complete len:254 (-) Transcript_51979:900-1661(-)